MSLRVKCKCGKVLNIPSKLADKKIACPGCKKPFRIPLAKFQSAGKAASTPPTSVRPSVAATSRAPALASATSIELEPAIADLSGIIGVSPSGVFDDMGPGPAAALSAKAPTGNPTANSGPGPVCPSCKQTLPPGAKICVQCGINVTTGRSLVTSDDGHIENAYETAEETIRYLSWIVWIGMSPIASEAYGGRKPWVVRSIGLLTIVVSLLFLALTLFDSEKADSFFNLMLWSGKPAPTLSFDEYCKRAVPNKAKLNEEARAQLRRDYQEYKQSNESQGSFHAYQLLSHTLLHGGPLHLAGNMIFLFVFGSRVNALIGNIATLIVYPILAIFAGWAHCLSTADAPLHPLLGASGAIMGLAGMYFIFFPVHKVHMAAWVRLGLAVRFRLLLKIFAVKGFWVVLFYIASDVAYTAFGVKDGVAHWAHLGGFIAGAVIAMGFLLSRRIDARGGDLLSAILGKRAWVLIGKPNRKALSTAAS